eukprot:jgi/Bigna1/70770/fgenesh1_pg.13_\
MAVNIVLNFYIPYGKAALKLPFLATPMSSWDPGDEASGLADNKMLGLVNKPVLLVLIFDSNPIVWAQMKPAEFDGILQQTLMFLNSILLQHHSNQIAVIASHPAKSKMIFPASPCLKAKMEQEIKELAAKKNKTGDEAEKSRKLRRKELKAELAHLANPMRVIVQELAALAKIPPPSGNPKKSRLAASLSRALCYARHVKREYEKKGRFLQSRIMVIDTCGSMGANDDYVPIMNAIFSARNMGVQIDSLVMPMLGKDHSFLQQASMQWYMPDGDLRDSTLPSPVTVVAATKLGRIASAITSLKTPAGFVQCAWPSSVVRGRPAKCSRYSIFKCALLLAFLAMSSDRGREGCSTEFDLGRNDGGRRKRKQMMDAKDQNGGRR